MQQHMTVLCSNDMTALMLCVICSEIHLRAYMMPCGLQLASCVTADTQLQLVYAHTHSKLVRSHCIHLLTWPVSIPYCQFHTCVASAACCCTTQLWLTPISVLCRLTHCADFTVLCGNRGQTVRWPRSGQSSFLLLLLLRTLLYSDSVPWEPSSVKLTAFPPSADQRCTSWLYYTLQCLVC